MPRVLALVEGPTERNFGQSVLAPHFGSFGIEYHPRVIGKPGHKGGVGAWEKAKREILGLICQEPRSIVTTMFDFYALPNSWPGREEARTTGLRGMHAAEKVEQSIAHEVGAELGASGPPVRFLAYLSLHEYEALLFSDPAGLASVTRRPDHADQFRAIVDQCGGCEEIDDGPQTAPSKRILDAAPGYQKTVDGIIAAQRIGLTVMRSKCPHFNTWLANLEKAAVSPA